MHWRPLHQGSKNPPLEKQILLRGCNGSWGIGVAFKSGGKVYFDYLAMEPTNAWYGAAKDQFTHWCPVNL